MEVVSSTFFPGYAVSTASWRESLYQSPIVSQRELEWVRKILPEAQRVDSMSAQLAGDFKRAIAQKKLRRAG